jgi:hypothetical protein
VPGDFYRLLWERFLYFSSGTSLKY